MAKNIRRNFGNVRKFAREFLNVKSHNVFGDMSYNANRTRLKFDTKYLSENDLLMLQNILQAAAPFGWNVSVRNWEWKAAYGRYTRESVVVVMTR